MRANIKVVYKESIKNVLQKVILDDFKKELEKIKNKKITIIPCGKTAEVFFEAANIKSDNWTVIVGVPHPSFGNI